MNRLQSIALAWLSLAPAAQAADLAVYDDQLRNGFANMSWGSGEDLGNPAPVHAGTHSIRFVPDDWNGVSFATSAPLNTTAYRGLRLWVHGGAAGGQQLRLFVADSSATPAVRAEADLTTVLGGAIPAGQWTQVEASFDGGPLGFTGAFDTVYVMDWRDGAPQAQVYLDDIVLLERAAGSTGATPIFSSGFEAAAVAPANGVRIDAGVDVGGFRSDRYTWLDSAMRPRSAAMVRNAALDPAGHFGGYLRQLTYQLPDSSTRTVTGSFDQHPGFGYVVSHFSDGRGVWGVVGYDTPGQYRTLFAGRHHAIHRYTQTIPMAGTAPGGGIRQYPVGVTIDWTFATGRDHPLWSISYDMSAAPAGAISGDSRSPYGDLTYDGAAPGSGDTVMGVAWGERYAFMTNGGPLTRNTGWTWTATNTVPYANQWTQHVDAEMGLVQTQTIVQQDAGGYWGFDRWGTTSATGLGCSASGATYQMPCDWNWPYQLNQYSFLGANDTTISKRMAWGTNYGFLGEAAYSTMGFAENRPGHPRQSYNLYVVLDRHSISPTAAQTTQIEVAQTVTLTATIGQVIAQGPAGAGRSDTKAYQPAGYDHVYGTWNVQAASNAAALGIQVGSGVLRRPVFVVRGYTADTLPRTVRVDGVALVEDVDYFPSVDASGDALWLTLNRDLTGSHTLAISP